MFRLPCGPGVPLLSSHSGTRTEGDPVSWALRFSWWQADCKRLSRNPPASLKAGAQAGAPTSTLILLVKASHVGGRAGRVAEQVAAYHERFSVEVIWGVC